MPSQIQQIASQTGYKNLAPFELELKPLNIIIGENGTGKSNFLSLFALLSAGATESLADFVFRNGGIEALLPNGLSTTQQEVHIGIHLAGISTLEGDYDHDLHLAKSKNSFEVSSERITYNDSITELWAEFGAVRLLKDHEGQIQQREQGAYKGQELVIAQVRDKSRYPLLDELRVMFAHWIHFHGFGEQALANIHEPQALEAVVPLRVDPLGRNLMSVLHSLNNNARYDHAYERLQTVLEAAFPSFKKLDFKQSPGSPKVALYWRTKQGTDFPTYLLSDGILRFLGLATLLLLPEPPSLITIDEPEIGLHPKLIPLLSELLKEASQRTQVIVTTHSPLLLEYADLEDVVLAEADSTGQAQLIRASSLDHLANWLEDFSLGSLWTMGKLQHRKLPA